LESPTDASPWAVKTTKRKDEASIRGGFQGIAGGQG
jgi:hypothetical protein